ncbi:MAG: hypothetical protein I4O49_01385, partial [Janthinobacterium lividum]|nr:hypothetical protein [Janthinobacterium lividum]
LDAGLAAFFVIVVISVLFFGIRTVMKARADSKPSTRETPFQAMPTVQ